MKNVLIYLLVFCFITAFTFAGEKNISIKVKNSSKLTYTGEVVSVDWSIIQKKDRSFTKDNISIIEKTTGKKVLSQVSDNNGDGKLDELLFLTYLKPNETKEYLLTKTTDTVKLDPLVSLKFVKGREDIAWESDKIAYRMYGPALAKEVNNGIDIWTKRVKYPIVDKWYTYSEKYSNGGKDTYHKDTGEGADFFDVGRSLGAGSACLWKNDSLYQPGVFDTYRFIENGPIRIIFEVNYKPVVYEGSSISEKKRISIDAGSNLNKIEDFYYSEEKNKNIEIAAGIVKRKSVTSSIDKKNGIINLWGPTNDDPVNEFLAIGVVFPLAKIINYKENDKHILVVGKNKVSEPLIYYSGAGWTRMGDLKNEQDWNNYLVDFSKKLKNKLVITVK
jgi:pectinesterase